MVKQHYYDRNVCESGDGVTVGPSSHSRSNAAYVWLRTRDGYVRLRTRDGYVRLRTRDGVARDAQSTKEERTEPGGGVSAYPGAVPFIEIAELVAAALSTHSVEAGHASSRRALDQQVPFPEPFDEALSH
jgi:hypothetical protein